MFITVHPVDRVLPSEFEHARGWASQVLALLPAAPAGYWAGPQTGSSTGALLAAWPDQESATAAAECEGSTPARVTLNPGVVFPVDDVHVGVDFAVVPGVMQLTWFHGPRTQDQVRADELSDRRVSAALADLPGLCGALLGYGPENARLIVSFADSQATLHASLRRIMASDLIPGEDRTMLIGPDLVQVCEIIDASGPLSLFDQAAVTGGAR